MRLLPWRAALSAAFAASFSALAACGSGDPAGPVVDLAPDGGPGDADAHPDTSDPDGAAREVAFDDAFALLPTTCRAQGITGIIAKLPARIYQFADCTFSIQPRAGAHALSASIVSAPASRAQDDAPWHVAVTTDSADPALVISVAQKRLSQDWSIGPLVLRFDFVDAAGRAAFTKLTLSSAEEAAIVRYDAPRVPPYGIIEWTPVNDAPYFERVRMRHDGAGLAVFRAGEPIVFEAPLTLADGVTAGWLGGDFTVTLDAPFAGADCLFGNVWPPGSDWYVASDWYGPNGRDWLSVLTLSKGDPPCQNLAANPKIVGVVHFDPRFGPGTHDAPFAVRTVDALVHDDLQVDIATNAGAFDGVRLTNKADYDVPVRRAWLAAGKCVGEDTPADKQPNVMLIPLGGDTPSQVVDTAPLAPAATRSFDLADVSARLRAGVAALQSSCASQTWTFDTVTLEESSSLGIGFSTTHIATDVVTIHE